ncbi:MAG: VOC family protein [Bauldia sp.]|nr:VOC family protein [Bauldia sp.]
MGRVVHFEIHADDPGRAADFYRSVFGWEISKWDGPVDYWLVGTGPDDKPGINGAILPREGAAGGDGITAYVCSIEVDDIDAALARALTAGAAPVMPKQPIPGIGWSAYARDIEGNLFGLIQNDANVR